MQTPTDSIDIIIPVYSGYDESIACIESVFASLKKCKTKAEVVIVYDAGPDPKLRDSLLSYASKKQISLLINDVNQGFVRSVNLGITRSKNDVLLLNSDTVVANDWLDRLVSRAYISSNIATVTPFSNNAEICSWPQLCVNNTLPKRTTVEQIDSVFAQLDAPSIEIPTAVGFCMFIKREVIDRIGIFDADAFGRGYGEENDFCMRAKAISFTHVLASNVFVKHTGGVSFGDEKESLVNQAIEKLDALYPTYNAEIAAHIFDDPARKWRFAAELLLQGQLTRSLVLHISHGIGGGTDKHVVELAGYCQNQSQHAMLVPQANCMRLVFPNVESGGLFEFPFSEMRDLKQFLFSLSLDRVHLHHIKGWEDHIVKLLEILDVPYDVTIHDYYFLHINPALADKQGMFCIDEKTRDANSADAIAFKNGLDGPMWREKWFSILNRAERVIAPSNSAAKIYNSYFPQLSITVAPHPDGEKLGTYPNVTLPSLSSSEDFRVLVLGAVSIIKGANSLEQVSQLAVKANLPLSFTLAGYAFKKLAASVRTTGAYDDNDLKSIIEKESPHVIWFPCTWPETYSYTLSTALEAGIPVICPNIGSFPERVQNRPFTWVEDWRLSPNEWLERIKIIRSSFGASESKQWLNQPVSKFSFEKDYRHSSATPEAEFVSGETLMNNWLRELPEASKAKGRLYRALIWLNTHKIFGHVANLVPFWFRQTVKRKLSTRPLHD